jgi:hypothetical protein
MKILLVDSRLKCKSFLNKTLYSQLSRYETISLAMHCSPDSAFVCVIGRAVDHIHHKPLGFVVNLGPPFHPDAELGYSAGLPRRLAKRKRLESKGWKVGTVSEFLGVKVMPAILCMSRKPKEFLLRHRM